VKQGEFSVLLRRRNTGPNKFAEARAVHVRDMPEIHRDAVVTCSKQLEDVSA
jgi:hypothetical protein